MKDKDAQTNVSTDILIIEGNALIFNNTLYQISNISAFELKEHQSVQKHKYPKSVFFLVIVAIVLYSDWQNTKDTWLLVISIITAFISIVIHGKHQPETFTYTYGLGILLNSGHQTVFVTENKTFATKIVSDLYSVLATPQEMKKVVINFKDNSVKIDNISNSNVVAGNSTGNLTNN